MLPIMGTESIRGAYPFFNVRAIPNLGTCAAMANRVAELREALGLSQSDLAEMIGTTKSQLGKLERGERRLSDHWAQRLAPHLGVQAFELFMPNGMSITLRQVPLIGRISCGNWQEAIENPEGSVPTISGGPRSFALRPEGDSMDQLIADGDGYVVIDPDQLDLIDGKVYAVMNGDCETTVKMYRASPARLVPCSSNPSHKTILVGKDEFRTIGRVVWKASEV